VPDSDAQHRVDRDFTCAVLQPHLVVQDDIVRTKPNKFKVFAVQTRFQ